MIKKIIVLSLLVLTQACTEPAELASAPVVNKVKTGEELKIVLAETHQDGATWQLKDDYDKNMITRLKEVWHGPEKGIFYYFRAKKEGRSELHFIKRFYTDTLDQMTFIIEVKP